ncbi:MAG: hypothetical protein IJM06_03355 [Firmicutes bacterium]|nr:hypothetical protein [Bacillota bacterium]
MKIITRIVPVLITASLVFSMSGCGASPEKVREGAKTALASLESYKMNTKTDIKFSSDGNDTTTVSEYTFDIVESPFYEKIEMSDTYDGEETKSTMYIQEAGDEYELYMVYDDAWIKQSVDSEYLAYITGFYNFRKSVSDIIENADSFTISGRETFNGEKCIKGVFTYNEENLKQGLLDINAIEALGFTDMDDSMIEGAGSLDITVLFDSKTYIPVKYSYDLKPVLQIILDKMYKEYYNISSDEESDENTDNADKITVGSYLYENSISDINSIEASELPEEVKSAISFEEYYNNLMAEYYSDSVQNAEETPAE